MKWYGHIGIVLLLAMAACTQKIEAPKPVEGPTYKVPSFELASIDSLMWQRPDSAFVLLQEFAASSKAGSLDAFGGHYFQLLLSELLYKNDYAQTNRTELQQAVAYFDNLTLTLNDKHHTLHRHCGLDPQSPHRNDNLVFLDARAHYINGVGYYERDSVVEACEEYLKALETMEEHFKEKDLVGRKAQFMAIIHTHLSNLFSYQYLHEQAIYFCHLCLMYYQKYEVVPWHIAWTWNEIGTNYDMMEKLDSANYYYRKAIDILDDSTLIYRNIAAHQAILEYKMGHYKANTAISRIKHLLSSSESSKENALRYSYIGEILYQERQFDSARLVFDKVFQETTDIGIKRQAAERLVEICKALQRNEEIIEYAEFLVPFANQEENRSEIKSKLTELYKTYNQDRLDRQHQIETKEYIKRTTIVGAGLFFVILILSLLYHKNKRHKRDLETLVESERHAHKVQQAALAGRLKRSNAALKEQIDTKQVMDLYTISATQHGNTRDTYEEELICQHILALCSDKKNPIKSTVPISAYADIALNDMQKAQLKDAAKIHYSSFFEKLRLQYPELKEKDLQYCYLCLLGLDNTQIAVMLHHSVSTIWERENRLKRILGSDNRVSVTLRVLMMH